MCKVIKLLRNTLKNISETKTAQTRGFCFDYTSFFSLSFSKIVNQYHLHKSLIFLKSAYML